MIIVTKSKDDIPFNIQHLNYLSYTQENPRWAKILRDQIRESIEKTLSDPLRSISMFLDPMTSPAEALSERQMAIAGSWEGKPEECGDTWVENGSPVIAMEMQLEISLRNRNIVGSIVVTPVPLEAYHPVTLTANGEFYSDDIFELIYRSRVRKQSRRSRAGELRHRWTANQRSAEQGLLHSIAGRRHSGNGAHHGRTRIRIWR